MKKIWSFIFLSVCLMMTLAGCAKKDTRDFNVEHHNWIFSNLVSSENGEVAACGSDVSDRFSDIPVIEAGCRAEDGQMTIRIEDKEMQFQYQISGKDTNSIVYELNGEQDSSVKMMAVSSVTEYARGKYEYTLVIDMDGYALYFYDREGLEQS